MATAHIAKIGKEDLKIWDGKTRTFSRRSSTGGYLDLNVFDWPGIDVLQAYGSGSYSTSAEINEAITSSGSNTRALWFAPVTWIIGENVTLPSNIYLVPTPGCLIAVSSGYTLTIGSPENIYAQPNQQIFSGVGTVAFTNPGTVYPNWWGTDEVAINAAISSVPAGSQIRLLPDTYTVTGTGTQMILLNKAVDFIGSGAQGSILSVNAAGGATTDIIRVDIPGVVRKMKITNFKIVAAGGVPGQHGIYIDCSTAGQQWSYCVIEDLYIDTLGGRSIYIDGGAADRFFHTRINRNILNGGIYGTNIGDNVDIEHNLINNTAGYSIEISQVSNAAALVIRQNSMIGAGGVRLHQARAPEISSNQIEPATLIGGTGSLIYIQGDTSLIYDTKIINNTLSIQPALANVGIYLDYARETIIENNAILSGEATDKALVTTANTYNTKWGVNSGESFDINAFDTATELPTFITDAGVATRNVRKKLTLENSWVKHSTEGIPTYWMDENRQVHFDGAVKDGIRTTGTTIFTVPIECKPNTDIYTTCFGASGGTYKDIQILVDSNGAVKIYVDPAANVDVMYLNQLTWRAAYYNP